jgi:hypothetical protein
MSARKNTVRADLTADRRRPVENKAFAAFARRIVRAFSRRVAQGDIDALTDLLEFAANLDDAIQDAVTGLREYGYSWSEIAQRAGIRKQTACERWGSKQVPRVVCTVQVAVHSEASDGEL